MIDATIRLATPDDVNEIWQCICDLAEYERSLDQVSSTPEDLRALLFGGIAPGVASSTPHGQPGAWCHVVELADPSSEPPRKIAGFALWFLNTSTWTGRHGLYLEDLYVRPEFRGRGYGQRLLSTLAAECLARGYSRLEWWVLDWNTPSIDFYISQGAVAMDEWTVYRVDGQELGELAASVDTVGS